MSTEHQRFSLDNQRAAIAAYAHENGFEVVATYQDSGKSGLTLKARPALKRLLSDLLHDPLPFNAILVLDVSRWGRFQDADQAAHYEYMCREAGAPVLYCGEAFDNDGGAMATLVKQMKRVMAAEYSRELSAKVARAQRQQARLGYKQGGPAVIGTRRQVIDEHGRPKMILMPGQRKGMATDRVTFTHGPARETSIVRLVFDLYVTADLKISEVAAELNRRRRRRPNGQRWHYTNVLDILDKEIFTGTYVYGRVRNNLGARAAAPFEDQIRTSVMEPIVSREIFEAACAKRRLTRRLYLSDEQLLEGLRRHAEQEKCISELTVRACTYLPGPGVFRRRFGSFTRALNAIGYKKPYRTRTDMRLIYSDEDLYEALRRIHREKGLITQRIINADKNSPNAKYFRRRLGTLKGAYTKIGITSPPCVSRVYRNADGTALSKELLLSKLSNVLKRNGYLTRSVIDSDPDSPSAWFYHKAFGSMLAAYSLVGYCADHNGIMSQAGARRRARNPERQAGAAVRSTLNPESKI